MEAREVEVVTRFRADTGLLALETEHFDAVILDVMLPDLDGFEVCKRIRERSNIPILMLTARGDETDRIVGLEIGADDYLPKPFSPRELLARLRPLLERDLPGLLEHDVPVHGCRADLPDLALRLV